jgi:hypothetical protein
VSCFGSLPCKSDGLVEGRLVKDGFRKVLTDRQETSRLLRPFAGHRESGGSFRQIDRASGYGGGMFEADYALPRNNPDHSLARGSSKVG